MPRHILHILPTLESNAASTQVAMLCEHLPRDDFEQQVAVLRKTGKAGERLRRADTRPYDLRRRHAWDPFAWGRLRAMLRNDQPDIVLAWGAEAMRYAKAAGVGDRLVHAAEEPRGVAKPQTVGKLSRAELGLPEGVRLIGAVTRLAPAKRVKELIWAIDLVRVLHEDVWLVVVGDGPARPAIERFNALASEENRTLLLGERVDVADLLPHFQLLWHAGQEAAPPLAMLEAMAAGLPVIADHSPGAEMAIRDGESGSLIRPKDRAGRAKATIRLLEDDTQRLRCGEEAQRKAEQEFPLAAWLDRHQAIYGAKS